MEVTTSGRIAQAQAHLDCRDVPPIPTKDGKFYPAKAVVSYQFLWSTGSWHVLNVKITGFRNQAHKGNASVLTLTNPSSFPEWLAGPIQENTPASLIKPEVSA
ncbi:hypothetical protein [Nonomuraea sp. NPDC050786]|uniref:hypothetical protein n=1 Tax=Nonomuraea sp. NPDC050786 TaxID=3154840 RepID=UPI00340DCD94